MSVAPDQPVSAEPHGSCYAVAMILMFAAVTLALVQKKYESSVAVTVAKRYAAGIKETDEHQNRVRQIIRSAEGWQTLSIAAIFLAIVSWAITVSRSEKWRGARVILISLLALYVGLQLIMV
jgi:hypothetical protein